MAEPNKTLFVVNFEPHSTFMDDLRAYFEQWGDLERVQLKTKFAFVEVRTLAGTCADGLFMHQQSLLLAICTFAMLLTQGDTAAAIASVHCRELNSHAAS